MHQYVALEKRPHNYCKNNPPSDQYLILAALLTLPIVKILSVKNARAWVSMVSYLKKINEN